MLPLLNIHWNPDPELFNLFGISIRYYGLLWVIGLAFAYFIVQKEYRDRRIGDDKFEPLFFYCTLGLIIALWLYCRKTKMHYMDVLDMIAVATPITACCIRLANLMNSEIIGNPSSVPWAFVFERVDMVPRHPAQLYEALAYFIFFLGMIYFYRKTQNGTTARRGFFFGLCLTEIFLFRFFIEFLKENQVSFEDGMTLNMGQWLSVPFVIIGIYCMFFYDKKKTA